MCITNFWWRTMALSRQQFQFGAIVATVSTLVGALSAIVALYTQVSAVVEGRVASAIKQDFAPVGTIISSVLPPTEFAKAVGEIEGDGLRKRKWILADARDVTDTEYARKTEGKPIPDLRGMFLRGINPNSLRIVGSLERYATALPMTKKFTGSTTVDGNHLHGGGAAVSGSGDRYNAGGRDYAVINAAQTALAAGHSHQIEVTGGGDDETRPDNVAVYFYIKIN
jgi:hypothetical protein